MTTLPTFRPPDGDFSRYERPAAWTCGRACEGRRCSRGPTPQGRCQELDRPCVPQRSLRSRRRIFVLTCIVLTIAALSMMLSKACWTEALAPGPLTLKHAQILNKNSTSNRCAACHEAGNKSAGEWALSLVSSRPLQTPQSTLCLKCHAASGERQLPDTYLLPHGVSPEKLPKHSSDHHQIACAACHREHHGKDHDLAAMSNQQCQTCHAKSFRSFASGHPEFTNWPFEQPSPIKFDHAGHKAKHFPAGKQEFRCQACHVDDSRQDAKLLAGYEAACASCHEPKIKQSGQQGFAIFKLPGLNVAALQEAGYSIGEWPAGISNDFDGMIPPAMALLLSADAKTAKALAKIPGSDMASLDAANKEHLAAAAEVVLASKLLLHELSTEGEVAFSRRVKDYQSPQLWGQLPPDVLRAAQAAWLPKLADEMAQLREGKPLSLPTPAADTTQPSAVIKEPETPEKKPTEGEDLLVPENSKPADDEDLLGGSPPALKVPEAEAKPAEVPAATDSSPSSGWLRSDASFTIAWRPTGHGDSLLKAWIELAQRNAANATPVQAALQGSLTKATSIGYCAQCHTLGSDANAAKHSIQWRSSHQDSQAKPFTKFSHRPHLIQPQLGDCSHCHEMSTTGGGFAPLTKSACISCHTPAAAGDQCLKCHNYHVSP
jgi:hypothetical protein